MSNAQQQAKPKSIIIRPYHRRNSDRQLESTKNSPNPVFLNVPEQMAIAERSFCLVKDDAYTEQNKVYKLDEFGFPQRRDIRWFAGCKSIFVEDQEKTHPNYTVQFQDIIFIKNGFLEVTDTATDHLMFMFLTLHNDNVSNPDRVVPPTGEDTTAFEVINMVKDASQEISKEEEEEVAYQMLQDIKTGTGPTRTFDSGKLGKLKAIFGIQKESNEEIYVELKQTAKNDPKFFLSRIEQARFIVLNDFNAALDAKVIKYDPSTKEYLINEEVVFTATASAKKPAKIEAEFIEFLSTEAGFVALSAMKYQTQENLTNPK